MLREHLPEIDILPTLEGWGFYLQTAIAGVARLTSL